MLWGFMNMGPCCSLTWGYIVMGLCSRRGRYGHESINLFIDYFINIYWLNLLIIDFINLLIKLYFLYFIYYFPMDLCISSVQIIDKNLLITLNLRLLSSLNRTRLSTYVVHSLDEKVMWPLAKIMTLNAMIIILDIWATHLITFYLVAKTMLMIYSTYVLDLNQRVYLSFYSFGHNGTNLQITEYTWDVISRLSLS